MLVVEMIAKIRRRHLWSGRVDPVDCAGLGFRRTRCARWYTVEHRYDCGAAQPRPMFDDSIYDIEGLLEANEEEESARSSDAHDDMEQTLRSWL